MKITDDFKSVAFYHYTDAANLPSIAQEGLCPRRRFIPLGQVRGLPEKAYAGALFGLLSPLPDSWLGAHWSSAECCVLEDVMHGHIRGRNIALLKVMPEPGDDVHVADWGVHFDPQFDGTAVSPPPVVQRVKEAYFQSLTSIFSANAGQDFRLPEVIGFSTIAPEKLKLVEIMPREELQRRVTSKKALTASF